MSKESLLKLLLEDTPRDELREVIQEIMKTGPIYPGRGHPREGRRSR